MPYDPDWPRRFERERDRLEQALAPWLSSGVHHIGSTAVPGLAAKPVIDMMAGVQDLAEARAAFRPLRDLEYAAGVHRPHEAHWFHLPIAEDWALRTHHLHLTEPGSDLWRERLAFRDALRADDGLRAEYQELKLRLARAHGADLQAYTRDKRDFVARVLAATGIQLGGDRP